jgi:hypothetical protein
VRRRFSHHHSHLNNRRFVNGIEKKPSYIRFRFPTIKSNLPSTTITTIAAEHDCCYDSHHYFLQKQNKTPPSCTILLEILISLILQSAPEALSAAPTLHSHRPHLSTTQKSHMVIIRLNQFAPHFTALMGSGLRSTSAQYMMSCCSTPVRVTHRLLCVLLHGAS